MKLRYIQKIFKKKEQSFEKSIRRLLLFLVLNEFCGFFGNHKLFVGGDNKNFDF